MNGNKLVCHISFNHSPFDDRIYWKELLSLKEAGYETVHIAVGDHYSDFISEEGVRIIIIKKEILFKPFRKFPLLNKALQALFHKKGTINNIFQVAASLSASVYHYHDLQINAITKALKNLPHKPKVIYDAHEAYHLLIKEVNSTNYPHYFLKKLASRFIPRWEIRNAAYCDYIITTDAYTNNYFEKNLPSIPQIIIYNYSYFLNTHHKAAEKKYDFIYSGLLSETRGIKEIIFSIHKCISTFPEIKLLLIGIFNTESFEKQITTLIKQLNLENNVTVKPSVPFQQMNYYYATSRIGLCLLYETPKYSTALPIKLFEYMAFELPVIFSNHGPSSQIISEENCGLLVDYHDINEVYNAMQMLLLNNELSKELGKNGKDAVIERYNWKREKNKLLTVYSFLNNK